MENQLINMPKGKMTKKEFRDLMKAVDKAASKVPGAIHGDIPGTLEHTFAGGMYIRKMTLPAGMAFTTKIHKKEHPYFILSGDATVITELGMTRIKGPYQGVTKVGTQRAIYAHEDTVWVTLHLNPTDTRDLAVLEDQAIAKSFEEIDALEKVPEIGGKA
uniref:Cupin n=1 Tax=viral metagenome TaxID=1070528 RepID=A0A6M3ISN8_9ZZZZ